MAGDDDKVIKGYGRNHAGAKELASGYTAGKSTSCVCVCVCWVGGGGSKKPTLTLLRALYKVC